MLSSFTLGEISPFTVDHSPERLFIYRMRSNWSAEGRLIRESVEQLHLEPSWGYGNPVISRWGQVGSVTVRRSFAWIIPGRWKWGGLIMALPWPAARQTGKWAIG